MDDSADVVARYVYGSFGEATRVQGSVDADFQFAGYYSHGRSGLNLMQFRAYNAQLGRFLNRDPIEENVGTNLFRYATNDPVNFIDLLGLQESGTGSVVEAGIGGITQGVTSDGGGFSGAVAGASAAAGAVTAGGVAGAVTGGGAASSGGGAGIAAATAAAAAAAASASGAHPNPPQRPPRPPVRPSEEVTAVLGKIETDPVCRSFFASRQTAPQTYDFDFGKCYEFSEAGFSLLLIHDRFSFAVLKRGFKGELPFEITFDDRRPDVQQKLRMSPHKEQSSRKPGSLHGECSQSYLVPPGFLEFTYVLPSEFLSSVRVGLRE